MSTYLDVPFPEKDMAKSLGARWDSQVKKWYVPEDVSIDQFQQWLPAFMYIVLAKQECWKCHKETKLVAVGIPYENDSLALLPRLECMPYEMRKYILEQGVHYHAKFSKTTGLTEINNCCEHCDSLQGEFFLFSEPDSPFMPASASAIEELEFYQVKLPHAPQGEVTSWSSIDKELFKYASLNNEVLDLRIAEVVRI